MKQTNDCIINWELHLLKVPRTKFASKIDDPFQSPLKRWLSERIQKFKGIFRKKFKK